LLVFALQLVAQPVDSITITVLPVFDEDGDYWGPYDYRWVYKIGNALHIKTRPATVKRFLPFDIGDTLSPELIAESERRLRGTDFISEAEIKLIETDSGNAAHVTVTDLWTTKLSPSTSYKGRVLEWWVEAEDVNFAGWGVDIAGAFRHDEDYDSWSLKLYMPKLLPGHISAKIYYSDATIDVGPTTSGFYLSRNQRNDKDKIIAKGGAYLIGGEYPTWTDNHTAGPAYSIDDFAGYFGTKYLPMPEIGIGFGIYMSHQHRGIPWSFSDETSTQPLTDRDLRVGTFGISLLKRGYFTARDVDAFGRTEDIPTGFLLSAEGGFGPRGYSPYARAYGLLAIRVGPIYGNFYINYRRVVETEASAAAFTFFTKKFISSRICGRAVYAGVSRDLPESYYRVGGQSCLRGYRSYAQTGERALFGNLETRIFTPVEVFSIRLGGAVFIDFGTAWNPTNRDLVITGTPKPILGDYGLELRFASTSSTTGQILKASIARTFDGEWEFALSAGQQFLTYSSLEHNIPIP